MGFSDIPPPTTSCLKRCRSEDPLSLTELCSPPPPCKLPFSHLPHHLSILQDLESSLNSVPAFEAAPTPEELVTEMMQSLEKVMADIGELIATSDDSRICAIVDSALCGGIPTADSPQAQDLGIVGDFVASRQRPPSEEDVIGLAVGPSETLHMCRDTAAPDYEDSKRDTPLITMIASLDDCRGMMASNCDAASASCTGNVGDGVFLQTVASTAHVCEEGCVRDGCTGLDSMQHVLDTSEGELGLLRATTWVAHTPSTEQNDEQWSLLDEFTDDFAASALPSGRIDWLEEGCDLPAFTLSQIEEEGLLSNSIDNSELLLLDCYL